MCLCYEGEYWDESTGQCEGCPENHYSPTNSRKCSPCPDFTKSSGGNQFCERCNQSEFWNGTRCQSCNNGILSNGMKCITCPSKLYTWENGSLHCVSDGTTVPATTYQHRSLSEGGINWIAITLGLTCFGLVVVVVVILIKAYRYRYKRWPQSSDLGTHSNVLYNSMDNIEFDQEEDARPGSLNAPPKRVSQSERGNSVYENRLPPEYEQEGCYNVPPRHFIPATEADAEEYSVLPTLPDSDDENACRETGNDNEDGCSENIYDTI